MDFDRPDPQDRVVRPTAAEWRDFAERHGQLIVNVLRPMADGDGIIRLTAAELASRSSVSEAQALGALAELVDHEIFISETVRSCGCCDEILDEEQATSELCLHCGEALQDCGIAEKVHYNRPAPRSRDVAWVLVLHGMNTRGAWQEELSWLIANTSPRSVPVFIYKYGRLGHGAFVRRRQRELVKDLNVKLRKLGETYGANVAGKPDVLAHSFGTWLIGHALVENPNLAVGRIVLAGSILRPDFEWDELLASGQVEAVLNHVAGRDRWVPFAQLVIPDAGPSGARGFADTGVIHRTEPEFGHSSFFDEQRVADNFELVWRPFLRRPIARVAELEAGTTSGWRPLPRTIGDSLRLALLCFGAALLIVGAASTGIGLASLLTWLSKS